MPAYINPNLFSVYGSTDAIFAQATNSFKAFVDANIDDLTIDEPWWLNTVTPAHTAFHNAYLAWDNKDNRTKLITATKNGTRERYEPLVSQYIEALRADPNVTREQLRALNIYKESHSSHPLPTTDAIPELLVESSPPKRLTIAYRILGEEGHKAKPPGVSHIEVAWDDELEAPPKKISELRHVDLFTRTPFILNDFDEEQRGTAVYMAARYVMNAEQSGYGDWSTVTYAVIP
jgi:hypothetical protein